jgi:hypothetical protein
VTFDSISIIEIESNYRNITSRNPVERTTANQREVGRVTSLVQLGYDCLRLATDREIQLNGVVSQHMSSDSTQLHSSVQFSSIQLCRFGKPALGFRQRSLLTL